MLSVVIDSAQPGPVHLKEWDRSSSATTNYYEAFLAAMHLWKYVKDYDPSHVDVSFSTVIRN